MMNKKIMYMAGVVLASLSLGAMTAQTVNAATTNPIRQGKKMPECKFSSFCLSKSLFCLIWTCFKVKIGSLLGKTK